VYIYKSICIHVCIYVCVCHVEHKIAENFFRVRLRKVRKSSYCPKFKALHSRPMPSDVWHHCQPLAGVWSCENIVQLPLQLSQWSSKLNLMTIRNHKQKYQELFQNRWKYSLGCNDRIHFLNWCNNVCFFTALDLISTFRVHTWCTILTLTSRKVAKYSRSVQRTS